MLFSVIVPVYKVESYIRKCVDSILEQSFSDFELILVDDGSPDACPKICDTYAEKDERVKVIHKRNGGLVSARNVGLMESSGKYVCYVDGDDWIALNLLERVVEKAIQPYQPDMVVYNMLRQFEDYQETGAFYPNEGIYAKCQLEKEIYPYMMWDSRKAFYKGMVFGSAGGKIIRRDLLAKHYCHDERIRMGEDNAFVYECLYAADSIYFLNEALYVYNQLNQGSMVHSYDAERFANNRILIRYLEKKLGGKDADLDKQINAFKAYWLIMAVFHEVKCHRLLISSARHLRKEIAKNHSLDDIVLSELPMSAQLFLLLLKWHFYILALFGGKIINWFRK